MRRERTISPPNVRLVPHHIDTLNSPDDDLDNGHNIDQIDNAKQKLNVEATSSLLKEANDLKFQFRIVLDRIKL